MRIISTSVVIVFFLICFVNTNLIAQPRPAIQWQKCIGGSFDDRANDVLINPDGTVLVVGYAKSNNGNIADHHGTTSTADGLIFKLDASGNLLWQKSYGGTNDDFIKSIKATSDGGYICTGYSNSNDGDITNAHGDFDAWVIKIDANGNLQWNKCYGGSKSDVGTDITITSDGQYAVMGTSYSVDGDVLSGLSTRLDADGWAFKISTSGNLIWEKCIHYTGTNSRDQGYGIMVAEDNHLFGIVSCAQQYLYVWSGGETVLTINPGYLFHIDNNTGNFNHFLTLGGERDFSMCSFADSIYYTFLSQQLVMPWNSYTNDQTLLQRTLGQNTTTGQGITNENNCCNAVVYHKIAPVHGIAADNGTAVVAGYGVWGQFGYPGPDPGFALVGTRLIRNPATVSSFANIKWGGYGGAGDDGFTSIKVYPAGNDYLAVGYTYSNDGDVSGNHGNYDCWIVRLNGLNKVTGTVFLDVNNNGIRDAGELPFDHDIVKTIKQGLTISGLPANGAYTNEVDTGTFVTSVALNRPYYSVTPASKTSTFTTYRNADTANFAVHFTPGIQDYMVSVAPLSVIRVGSPAQFRISYENVGTTTLTNKIITYIKDSRTFYFFSNPAYTSISGDTIRWNIANLPSIGRGSIDLYLNVAAPPVISQGETLHMSALIDSTGDMTPVDNYFILNQLVRGSYDPNDKQEVLGGELYTSDLALGKYLNYTIRFQNTGNDTAFTILLKDTLDSKLLADSIEVTSASHAYQLNIKDNQYMTIVFNNIMLVDSNHNEPLSHGYISYRIKPRYSLAVGDTIRNRAGIYFDYNPVVLTNTQITIVKPTPTTNFWTGAVSTAWEDPLNWGNHIIPNENTNVIINTGLPRYPVINSNAICLTIQIKTGASVLVKSGFTLNVTH